MGFPHCFIPCRPNAPSAYAWLSAMAISVWLYGREPWPEAPVVLVTDEKEQLAQNSANLCMAALLLSDIFVMTSGGIHVYIYIYI